MFAIATPQTVTLTIPGDDHPSTLINFRANDADTSRCVLEIVTPEGDTHRLTFNVRGQMVDSAFTAHDTNPDEPKAPAPASYMVNGVDTRAFNPYTYQPPVSADAANRTDAGFKAVNVPADVAKEHRELREKDEREAAERAKEMLDKHLGVAEENPQDKVEREKQEHRDRLEKAQATLAAARNPTDPFATHGLDTGDRPDADAYAKVKTFPNDETQRLVGGKRMDGSAQQNPDNAPMAPAPSSPLPGSPPPHPLDQPDPGKVNTSISLGTPPAP